MPRTTRSAAPKKTPSATKAAGTTANLSSGTATRRSLRGRLSNDPALADLSTAPTSTTSYSSGSEYATPLTNTSTVNTPAPSAVVRSSSKPQSRIVIDIPARPPADSHRALQHSIYAMNSKRKRDQVEDSEDDYYADNAPDAKMARKLQEEEDRRVSKPSLVPTSSSIGRRRSQRANPILIGDSEDEISLTRSSRKGKAVAKPVTSTNSSSKGKHVVMIPNSDDVDGESDLGISNEDDRDDSFADRRMQQKSRTRSAAKFKAAAMTVAKEPDPESLPESEVDDIDESVDLDGFDGYASDASSALTTLSGFTAQNDEDDEDDDDQARAGVNRAVHAANTQRRGYGRYKSRRRAKNDRDKLEHHHPELQTMWDDLKNMPVLKAGKAEQPKTISRLLKPFQLEGLAWMKEMEKTKWQGGLLGDEMGLGKTIQAVSLIMSDYPQKQPSLVLVPPVALMQWTNEIKSYTDGTLKTLVLHGTNAKAKGLTVAELKKYDVIMMSYNSLESMYRKQEKGFKRKEGLYKEKSIIHQTQFHRVILDEAHSIKTRTTMTAKACFALKVTYRWCLSGTPLQNRIGEFFSLVRFLNVQPFSCYLCKECSCSHLEWRMDDNQRCIDCGHIAMRHVSVFNQELLNPIQRYGQHAQGAEAFKKLRLLTDRIMLRRLKKDNTDSMELPVKEIHVDRQFFGEAENDFANSIMTNGQRSFETYVSSGVLLNNYANIFGLIMQMRQVADHPDLLLKKSAEGGQNVLVCNICDEPAEDAIRSKCKHDFCRDCVKSFLTSLEGSRKVVEQAKRPKKPASTFPDDPRCPTCHDILSIDLEQPEIEQDASMFKKSSIINRIKMENWTSSSKIELLVHELHKLRSDNASHKSIIFSQFTTMLQLVEWRLRRAGITSVMLDGSMTPAQRQASIEHFMNNADVECFLVSLKAGGVALNLTEASRVFIVDPWWNPAAEWQSADRCHRIGQTRPCTITRLCIEDSVESRMVLLQEKKANMINSTINSDEKAMESLTPEDLQFLFKGS